MHPTANRLSSFTVHFSPSAGLVIAAANLRLALLALISAAAIQQGRATGFYGPQVYLDAGGANLLRSPEFYWDVEVKRLARNYNPTEKRVPIKNGDGQEVTPGEENSKESIDALGAEMTANADTQDFATALKEGRIKPADPAQATAQHEAARKFIAGANDKTTDALPEEFPSEFADYHKGAFAYKLGKWDEARAAWQTLLNRPAGERHYRSVWAAFMLGKAALKAGDPQAVKWFELTRELAKTGFSDPLGLAADSYGWEGRSEWKQDHPAKAAQLFLTQLALGDEGAIVSLKALVPDRVSVSGMVNYGSDEDSSQWSDERRKAEAEKTMLALRAAAKDPLLRQLVTAHILAAADQDDELQGDTQAENKEKAPNRATRWLSVIDEEHIGQLENADYLGWVAYGNGDYKAAERWLKLADTGSPSALWLTAKLLRRAGKLDEAAQAMARAEKVIVPISTYAGWKGPEDEGGDDGHWSFEQSASGDLAALQLEQAQFIPAFETMLKGEGADPGFTGEYTQGALWDDAAFVAERVLSADELKAYVDRQPVPQGTPAKDSTSSSPIARVRNLLGRRLVREDRYQEAAQYLTPPYDKVLAEYVKALEAGANEKLSKRERARAWFKAAWLARYDGMEIMGTEGAPDGYSLGGEFEIPDLAKQQLTGFYEDANADGSDEKAPKHPIVLKPSKDELQRLSKTKISPDLRFHYRIIAGALAVRAADLLEDNTEELADVLNTAGSWVKDRDEKIGDRYFQILKARAAKTKIGRLAVPKHWFVSETGPWSEEQAAAEDKLHKELGIATD